MSLRRTMSATSLMGDRVLNAREEHLGRIEDLMIDLETGGVAYAVLSFGGFLGVGDKLFAIPWRALRMDAERRCFVLDIDREMLEQAPGFDKEHWPDLGGDETSRPLHRHAPRGTRPS
jgi:sporulation protein YlmC with PRC-barrel domain